MIKISYSNDTIIFKGHTRPDICAAVSSIMYTSANMLEKYDNDCFKFEDDSFDDFVCIQILKHDDIIDMVVNNMFDMIDDLLEDGNEDKIKIDRS